MIFAVIKPIGVESMTYYHEPTEELSARDRDIARALVSIKEEIEASEWYHERIATCDNAELRAILEHNRNEEFEHCAMLVEWMRKNLKDFADKFDEFYDIGDQLMAKVEAEEEEDEESEEQVASIAENKSKSQTLQIGSLK